MKGIASMADVLAIEREQPSLPASTYEMIRVAAAQHARSPALSFFASMEGHGRVAYVQLKPGAAATEAELMSFAAEHVAERAALPKKIRIIPAMPLTGVGKIFKPELKNREIEDSLAEALRDAGVEIRSLKVGADPTHGTTVEVSVAAGSDAQLARKVLGQFPFRFRLESY